jgi:tetratricopeptide (TPR) repeat protein
MAGQFEIRIPRKPNLLHVVQYLLFSVIVFLLAATRLTDINIWWRIAAGRAMAQSHTLLTNDIFSFTAAGQPWNNPEWLFNILAYLFVSIGGITTLILGKAFLLVLIFALLFRLLKLRCGNRYIAMAFVLWGVFVSTVSWTMGPPLFDLLFVVILLAWLTEYKAARYRGFYVPLLTFIVWPALASRSFIGIVLLAAYLLGDLIALVMRRNSGARNGMRTWLSLFCIVIICALIAFYMNSPGSLWDSGANASPFPAPSDASPLPPLSFPLYGLMLLAAVIALFMNITTMAPSDSVMLIVWALFSLRAARNIPVFALVAAPILAKQAAELIHYVPSAPRAFVQRKKKWFDGAGATLLAGILLWASFRPQLGFSTLQILFPYGATKYVAEHQPKGNMFNPFKWGGYLIWHLYPPYRVFIDSRAGELYPSTIWSDYETIAAGKDGWKDLCNRYEINFLILPTNGSSGNLIIQLWDSPDWRLAYWDFQSLLYLRAIPEHMETIAHYTYQNFDAETEQPRFWSDPLRLQSLCELKRYLKENPEAITPRSFFAMEATKIGLLDHAQKEYETLLDLNPKLTTVHHNLALIAATRGNEEKAVEEYNKEIEINPAFPPSLNNLGRLYLQKKQYDMAEKLFQKAIESDPNYHHARSNIAVLYMEKGDFANAAAEFEKVLRANPHDRAAFRNLKIAQQLLLQQRSVTLPPGKVYGPLQKEEVESIYVATPKESE